ncbi:MAG: hypothetical protein JWN24_59 [Phycisphaerales bacterium]|nr:hypothetical protein [Phycisphaerales bacterium]
MSLYSSTILADSPSAWWRLGELLGTSAADSSGNSRTATHSGSVTPGQPGATLGDNNAAALYAGGYTQIGDPAALRLFSQITLEAWIKTTQPADASNKPILTRWLSAGSGLSWYFGKIGANLSFYASLAHNASAAFTLVNDGAWHHVAAVAEPLPGGLLRIYVDGTERANSIWTATQTGTADWRIAGNNDSPTELWAGNLDEVAIYSAPLPASRVRAHYNAGIRYGIAPSPVGNSPFIRRR